MFLNQSQATGADLDGSVLPTATSAYQYDAYSNATQIQVVATDGFIKTTTNTYTNDTANWFLGRLTNASVASQITSPGSPPPQAPTNVIITNSSQNLNLWSYLLSNGVASAGVAGSWTVTIASGVVISSASSTVPALDTGVFPPGSILQLVNNGVIVGAGGKGGNGGLCKEMLAATRASPAARGLRAQVALSVVNNCLHLGWRRRGRRPLPRRRWRRRRPGSSRVPAGLAQLANGASGTVSNGRRRGCQRRQRRRRRIARRRHVHRYLLVAGSRRRRRRSGRGGKRQFLHHLGDGGRSARAAQLARTRLELRLVCVSL